jgi:hypothetical protein
MFFPYFFLLWALNINIGSRAGTGAPDESMLRGSLQLRLRHIFIAQFSVVNIFKNNHFAAFQCYFSYLCIRLGKYSMPNGLKQNLYFTFNNMPVLVQRFAANTIEKQA